MIKRICLDMDGVLCDFVGGTARLLGFNANVVTTWDYYPQINTTEQEFWDAIDKAGSLFWSNLDAYPWYRSLYDYCYALAPTVILTSPSKHPSSLYGKLVWLKFHIAADFRSYLMGSCKDFCACPGTVLIDDSDKNCEAFRAAGGEAILFPRPWNSNRDYSDAPFQYTADELRRLHYAGESEPAVNDIRTFESGAIRSSDADRERYDLITPVGLRRLAETYAEGAAKYGDRNWLKGFPASSLMNHAIRHIRLWLDGDSSEDHLAHASWNLFSIQHFEETRPDLIDVPGRPQYVDKESVCSA